MKRHLLANLSIAAPLILWMRDPSERRRLRREVRPKARPFPHTCGLLSLQDSGDVLGLAVIF